MKKLTTTQKNILLSVGMLFLVAIISLTTYFIVIGTTRSTQLTTPTNLSVQFENETTVLSWDKIEKANWYTVHINNRTSGEELTVFVYEQMYFVNTYNKIEYDVSNKIDSNYNYSITIRAMAEDAKLEHSNFCEPYELQQVDPSSDVDPL
jgi:hypothetical protein